MKPPLLSVEKLSLTLVGEERGPLLLRDLNFSLELGEALALVGESGCGKSLSAKALLDLLPPTIQRRSGHVLLEGEPLFEVSPARLRSLRGTQLGFVSQDPLSALNPLFSVGEQIAERLRHHGGLKARAAWARGVELMEQVGISAPQERARAYPHQLSGGMRQRALMAIALACDPLLLIADEPTTALDVSVQAQLMELLKEERRRRGMALLLITHDLGLVAQYVDRVLVMYAGEVVEAAPVEALFSEPRHPYTWGLLQAIPREGGELHPIPGQVPNPKDYPEGCRFAPRCKRRVPGCAQPQILGEDRHAHRCLRPLSPERESR